MISVWTAYIERNGKKYFVARGSTTEIMGMVYRRVADLELPDSIIRDVDYINVSEVPLGWGFLEELFNK